MSFLVLACSGLDKVEGSVAREVALRLAEGAEAEIVCPVLLGHAPGRYAKVLAEKRLVVVDGCATRCATKLAEASGARPAQRVVVSKSAKVSGAALLPGLRLDAAGIELARTIAEEVAANEATVAEAGRPGARMSGDRKTSNEVEFVSPSDYAVVTHDKYEFRIPLTGYLFNANDVWVQVAGTRARIGISDYMQQRLTDITFVDPPEMGTRIEQFDEAGTVESTKATFEVVSPVSGTVTAVNEAVTDAPDSINQEPYRSWIVELEMSDWEADRTFLVDGAAYAADVERKAVEDS
jgi:glycine cleavage system H protein